MDLPQDVSYSPDFFSPEQAAEHLAGLLVETPWEQHFFTIYGRSVPMPREIAMYGPLGYRYSGVEHPPAPFTARLQAIADRLEAATGQRFNSVLVNHYRDGRDSVSWHSDDDYAHGGAPDIASLSFGATRRFQLRARSGKRQYAVDLEGGSLLWMGGRSQLDFVHCLPKCRRPVGARINLTFRHMVTAEASPAR